MLVAALREYRGALRASLRAEYQIDLSRPDVPWIELADLVAHLPQGCALWRAAGGSMAWSQEVHMLAAVEYRLRVLAWQQTKDGSKGRNAPEPLSPPKSAHEKQAEDKRLESRAEAYLRRTQGG